MVPLVRAKNGDQQNGNASARRKQKQRETPAAPGPFGRIRAVPRRSATSPENLQQQIAKEPNKQLAPKAQEDDSRQQDSLLASNSYLLFSYLIPWNTTESVDLICTNDLLLSPPSPVVTFGLRRLSHLQETIDYVSSFSLSFSGDKMGIMVPASAQGSGRWQSSEKLTALHALSAVTFTKCLLFLGMAPQLKGLT